jgi:hypothetical protein
VETLLILVQSIGLHHFVKVAHRMVGREQRLSWSILALLIHSAEPAAEEGCKKNCAEAVWLRKENCSETTVTT